MSTTTTRKPTAIDTVETALDLYVDGMGRRGIDPSGFRVSTVAKLVGVSNGQMSQLLQRYRLAQAYQPPSPGEVRRGVRAQSTRYVVAARSYGPDARWRILAKPGTDPKAVREARREQAKWIARDAYNRIVKDLITELHPALGSSELDQHLADTMDFARGQFESVVTHIDRVLRRSAATVA